MNKDAGINKSSSFNTTESGMWENERKVCEIGNRSTNAPSDTTSDVATAAVMSPSKLDASTKNYLPQFIVRRFGDNFLPILTKSCQLKSKFRGKDGTIQHKYTVAWIEDGPVHQEINKMTLSSTASSSSKSVKGKKKNKKDINNNNVVVPGGGGAGGYKAAVAVSKTSKRKCCKDSSVRIVPAGGDGSGKVKLHSRRGVLASAAKKELSEISLKSEHSEATPSYEVMVDIGYPPKKVCQPEIRKCDGPCGEMRDVTDLRILGRCEHALCSYCIINAPMVPFSDGSMGCCNKRCFAYDLINQIPDPQRRHELYLQIFEKSKFDEIFKLYKGDIRRAKMDRQDLNSQYSSTSLAASAKSPKYSQKTCSATISSSNPSSLYESIESLSASSSSAGDATATKSSTGKYDLPPRYSTTSESGTTSSSSGSTYEKQFASEILQLHLVILESSYFSTIKRHHFEHEFEAKMPLMAAVECLMGVSAGRNLLSSKTRMFYCSSSEKMMNTDAMLEMNAKEHGCLTMGELATENGKINIIIDYTGKLIKDKRRLPPFTKAAVKNGGGIVKK